jgi:hypothetical protein
MLSSNPPSFRRFEECIPLFTRRLAPYMQRRVKKLGHFPSIDASALQHFVRIVFCGFFLFRAPTEHRFRLCCQRRSNRDADVPERRIAEKDCSFHTDVKGKPGCHPLKQMQIVEFLLCNLLWMKAGIAQRDPLPWR